MNVMTFLKFYYVITSAKICFTHLKAYEHTVSKFNILLSGESIAMIPRLNGHDSLDINMMISENI